MGGTKEGGERLKNGLGRGFSKKGQRRVIDAPFRIKDWVKETAQLHFEDRKVRFSLEPDASLSNCSEGPARDSEASLTQVRLSLFRHALQENNFVYHRQQRELWSWGGWGCLVKTWQGTTKTTCFQLKNTATEELGHRVLCNHLWGGGRA